MRRVLYLAGGLLLAVGVGLLGLSLLYGGENGPGRPLATPTSGPASSLPTANAPRQVTVPNVLTLSTAKATAELCTADLTVKQPPHPIAVVGAPGTVGTESPSGGTRVVAGATVTNAVAPR